MDNEAKKEFFDANCKFNIGDVVYSLPIKDRHKGIALLVVTMRNIHECHGGFQQEYHCQGDGETYRLNESSLMSEDEFFDWLTTSAVQQDKRVQIAREKANLKVV